MATYAAFLRDTGVDGTTIVANPDKTISAMMAGWSDTIWYVDSDNGLDTSVGTSWAHAFLTIATAITASVAFDTILIRGATTFTEDLEIPLAKKGLKLVGTSGSKVCPKITSTVAGNSALTIYAPRTEVYNIHFDGTGKTVPFIYCRREDAGATYNGMAGVIANCYFHGHSTSYSAICYSGGVGQFKLLHNHFQAFGGTGATYEAAVWSTDHVAAINDCDIIGNWFTENTSHLRLLAGDCLISGNSFLDGGFHKTANFKLDTKSNGEGGGNLVCGNYFDDQDDAITIANGYIGATTDAWVGNFCIDALCANTAPPA